MKQSVKEIEYKARQKIDRFDSEKKEYVNASRVSEKNGMINKFNKVAE